MCHWKGTIHYNINGISQVRVLILWPNTVRLAFTVSNQHKNFFGKKKKKINSLATHISQFTLSGWMTNKEAKRKKKILKQIHSIERLTVNSYSFFHLKTSIRINMKRKIFFHAHAIKKWFFFSLGCWLLLNLQRLNKMNTLTVLSTLLISSWIRSLNIKFTSGIIYVQHHSPRKVFTLCLSQIKNNFVFTVIFAHNRGKKIK